MKKKSKENVLAYGEKTGHAHRIDVDVFEDESGLKSFEGKTKITHEEHKPIEIPDGKWTSGIVNEYDYFQDLERKVAD